MNKIFLSGNLIGEKGMIDFSVGLGESKTLSTFTLDAEYYF